MKYDLVVSDFDDTLLSDDHTVSEKNIETINAYVERGGKFLLCTGRMFSSIRDEARKLGLKGWVGCYQGGMIADIESGKILISCMMESGDVVAQLRELEARKIHSHLYHDDTLFVKELDDYAKQYEKLSGIRCAVTGEPLSTFAERFHMDAHKLMGIDKNEIVAPLLKDMQSRYPHLEYVLSKPIFLEILPKEATKGKGMKRVAELFHIRPERIAACGDSLNDLSMIREAGLGAAVANALDEVKRAAKVTLNYTNNQDAIAHLIEEYVW